MRAPTLPEVVRRRAHSMYSPESTDDGPAVVYIWHVKIGSSPEFAVRATHVTVTEEANVFLVDRNYGDAIVFYAPRSAVTYIQRYGAVTKT